jgi:hypothetical protein
MGLHAPLQHSASAAQAAPLALQATSCRSGEDAFARPCSAKNAITLGCEAAACSSSHAAAGNVAMPIKIAKNVAINAEIRMIISLWGCPSNPMIGPRRPSILDLGQKLSVSAAAYLLTRDEARRIAANIGKLPGCCARPSETRRRADLVPLTWINGGGPKVQI